MQQHVSTGRDSQTPKKIRPSPSLSRQRAATANALCYLFFVLIIGLARARIVGDSDDEVKYTPPELGTNLLCISTLSDGCSDRWYSESMAGAFRGAVKSTPGPNASLQITFRGSMIVVKGVTDRRGARAFVRLNDGPPNIIDTESGDKQRHVGVILYSMPGLNATVDHTLSIEYDPSSVGKNRPRLLRIDSFEVADGNEGSGDGLPPLVSTAQIPQPTTPDVFPTTTATTTSVGNGSSNSDPPPISGTTSNSSTVPIIAGLVTGLATLIIASAIIYFLLRRRRAVRVQSMELPRTTPPSTERRLPPRMSGLANLAYAFNRRGESVTSSSDTAQPPPAPPPTQPLPPVPRGNTFVSPYTYQRAGPAYPMSDATSSIGPPVDERPPNIPLKTRTNLSPIAQSPRILRVHNPGSSVVSSSNAH